MNRILLFIFIFTIYIPKSFSQDANRILKYSEEKIRGITSSYTEMAIKIIRPKWKKEMVMKGMMITGLLAGGRVLLLAAVSEAISQCPVSSGLPVDQWYPRTFDSHGPGPWSTEWNEEH